MAEELETFEFHRGARRLHPWDEWLNGKIWRLDSGKDFQGKPATFRVGLSNNAAKRGVKVRTQIDGDAIVIQAYKPD